MSIVIAATLDTKGEEVAYLKKEIEGHGKEVFVVDCAILGEPGCPFDISKREVAAAAGTTIEDMLAKKDKNYCIDTMKKGLKTVFDQLMEEDVLEGVISVGGVQGTFIATGAMKELPIGIPKFMVSTVANGKAEFGPFVGASDMIMMHSVADIAGNNFLLNKILRQAGAAIAGMVSSREEEEITDYTKVIGITMGGVTTPCVTEIKKILMDKGYEVIIFHCNGIGALAMENLVKDGKMAAVFDISPHDIMDAQNDGLMPADENRLVNIAESGIPYVFVPGIADFILYNGVSKVPKEKLTRQYVKHNEIHTHVKADYDEMFAFGEYVSERLKSKKGSTKVLYPRKGLSQLNNPEGPLYAPEKDYGFIDGFTKSIDKMQGEIEIREFDLHINDKEFAMECVRAFEDILEEK